MCPFLSLPSRQSSPSPPREQLLMAVVEGGLNECVLFKIGHVMSNQQGQMITHLTKILVPAYLHIPVTPWKRVRCSPGTEIQNLDPYLSIPVSYLNGSWDRIWKRKHALLLIHTITSITIPLIICAENGVIQHH